MLNFWKKKTPTVQAKNVYALFPETYSEGPEFYLGFARIKLGEFHENPAIAFASQDLAQHFIQRTNDPSTILPLENKTIEKANIKKVFLFASTIQIDQHFAQDPVYMKSLENRVYSLKLAGEGWFLCR